MKIIISNIFFKYLLILMIFYTFSLIFLPEKVMYLAIITETSIAIIFIVTRKGYIFKLEKEDEHSKKHFKSLSIAGIMLNKRAKNDYYAILIVFGCILLYMSAIAYFNVRINYYLIGILVFLIAMLLIDILIFVYRLRNGLFPNNEYEAREIVEFILSETENIDFTDGEKMKSIISSADLKEYEAYLDGVLGENLAYGRR
ncbi:MAG: hypothetical protein GF353_02100 [Candidatus Lokiarchaeota archaeon]|nr:hypothetical protein [Candidatus Lokiarchaeota archaeon]